MKTSTAFVSLAAIAGVSAQTRPANQSICDYYTTALLKNNTAANQQTLLTLVVNTAVIGNYTTPNVGIAVPGILAPGTVNGTKVNLAPYFSGALASTNRGGSSGVSVNFLDGGAAAPLMHNMPANGTSGAQYTLLTHLYGYFANLLGCSQFGKTVTPYAGSTNMYNVHKFMALDNAQVMYFIQQVGMSAASFGVTKDDVAAVGQALETSFGYRCSPAMSIPASASPALQAICIASDCPQSPNATCSAYQAVVTPSAVSSASGSATGTATSTSASHSGTTSVTPGTGDAASMAPLLSSFGAVGMALGFVLL